MITYMPKTTITTEEWEKIEEQAKTASLFLESPRFKFIIDYLSAAQGEIEQMILNNTIRDVTEELTITESLKRSFFTPKKVQVDELSGQHKFIAQFFAFIQNTIDMKKQAEELEDKKKLVIDRSREK